jgi:uncharacterized protein DUF3489
MNAVTAVLPRQENMMTSLTKEQIAGTDSRTKAKSAKKNAKRTEHAGSVLPIKARSSQKSHQKSGIKPYATPKSSGPGGKTAKVLGLLRRPKGATLNELMKVTGWQPHSVRGFISGTLGKRMGLSVASTKDQSGDRRYSLPR